MASSVSYGRPRGRWLGLLFPLAVAFLGGLALAALAVQRSPEVRRWFVPAMTAPNPVAAQSMAPASGASEGVETRVGDLEGRLARIDLRAAAASGNAGKAEDLLVAFAARRALDRGAALGYLEPQLRARFEARQPLAIGAILTASRQPATIATLRQGLETVAQANARPAPQESLWDATRRTLGNLFVVRRASAGSPAPDDRLRRARLLVEGGQVDAAMAEVARLPATTETGAWLAEARRWVEAHRALDVIEATALSGPQVIGTP